jgi:hypothetical protein
MKHAVWAILPLLAAAPLLAQAIPGRDPSPQERPRSGGGGGVGIGISIPIGKKKPKEPKLSGPPLEMQDAEIPDYVAGEVLFFMHGDAAAAARIARAANVTIMEAAPLDELGEIMAVATIAPGDTVEAAIARLLRN